MTDLHVFMHSWVPHAKCTSMLDQRVLPHRRKVYDDMRSAAERNRMQVMGNAIGLPANADLEVFLCCCVCFSVSSTRCASPQIC